jgi:hypothetical protein
MPTIFTKGLSTNSRTWSDLDLDFQAHPVTKDIVRYERPFQPQIDGGVTRHLFELSSPMTKSNIEGAVKNAIANFEPRASVISIFVGGDPSNNGYDVTINFRVVNQPDPVTIELFLERLR